jgi:pimeloyl-ACP methyl ester carboxylesterase
LLKEKEKKPPTILILVCGDKTGENCETGYGPYGGDQPLSDYEEWADANGIQVEYFGFGEGETIGDVQARIEEFMEKTENAGANFILVGHSAGADAAWNAAYSQAEKGNTSRIRGVILLDAGAMEIERDDMNFLIGELINRYGIDVKSFSSGDYRGWDDDGKGTSITLPSNTISIPVQSHYALAVDNIVLDQYTSPILNGWISGH